MPFADRSWSKCVGTEGRTAGVIAKSPVNLQSRITVFLVTPTGSRKATMLNSNVIIRTCSHSTGIYLDKLERDKIHESKIPPNWGPTRSHSARCRASQRCNAHPSRWRSRVDEKLDPKPSVPHADIPPSAAHADSPSPVGSDESIANDKRNLDTIRTVFSAPISFYGKSHRSIR